MEFFRRQGMTFDVTDAGPADGPVVVLLHGFPEDRTCWDRVIPGLTSAGFRVLAPDQRGYSPGARPSGRRAYRIDELAKDVIAMTDAAGADRFDVVGHDWGAVVAWELAGRHQRRVRTLTALSVPHTQALLRSMLHSRQALQSWYMAFFQLPGVPERLLGRRGGQGLVQMLARSGLPATVAERYAARIDDPAALTGPVNWYRAIPFGVRSPLPKVTVPTLFVYGDGDPALSRAAADGCAEWVTGHYTYEVLPHAGHWLPELSPDKVTELVLHHLGASA